MKPSSITEIKKDLEKRNAKELLQYCLRLARYKKENKELLAFLLFESDNIPVYLENVKQKIELILFILKYKLCPSVTWLNIFN